MVYIQDAPESFTDEMYRRELSKVSDQRRKAAEGFLRAQDRIRSVLSYRLLQYGLNCEYQIDVAPEFIFNEYGKPFLKDYPQIYFSLSHCEKAIACAISESPIGIDIETLRPFDAELAEYVCSREEFAAISVSPEPEVAFTVLWTKKESLCKMLGTGLPSKEELRQILHFPFRASFETTVNKAAGYVVSTIFKIEG